VLPLQLRLPAELAAVERARAAVLAHLEPLALGARAVYAIELVIEETVTNIARHAYRGEAGHAFELAVDAAGDDIVLRFEDEGAPFDPRGAPAPARPATLDEAVPGGLGIELVRRYARRVGYERRAGRNVLTVAIASGAAPARGGAP
jgi:anti-sigma regulatory factor (Ser/Thr protein kinase)